MNFSSSVNQEITVNLDYTILNLIVRCFILSAIKYSSEGDLVSINASSLGEFVEVSIKYPALGTRLDDISKIFASNIQQIVAEKENESGESFGLALCKELIEKSGGKIWVDILADKPVGLNFTLPSKSSKLL